MPEEPLIYVQMGQKRRFERALGTSALPNFRRIAVSQQTTFRAISGLMHRSTASLFDHLVGECENNSGITSPSAFAVLEINDQLEFGRLLDGDIAWLCSFRILPNVVGSAGEKISLICSVRHQAAVFDPVRGRIDGRKTGRQGLADDPALIDNDEQSIPHALERPNAALLTHEGWFNLSLLPAGFLVFQHQSQFCAR